MAGPPEQQPRDEPASQMPRVSPNPPEQPPARETSQQPRVDLAQPPAREPPLRPAASGHDLHPH
jgi:hypothetical protein